MLMKRVLLHFAQRRRAKRRFAIDRFDFSRVIFEFLPQKLNGSNSRLSAETIDSTHFELVVHGVRLVEPRDPARRHEHVVRSIAKVEPFGRSTFFDGSFLQVGQTSTEKTVFRLVLRHLKTGKNRRFNSVIFSFGFRCFSVDLQETSRERSTGTRPHAFDRARRRTSRTPVERRESCRSNDCRSSCPRRNNR